MPHKKLFIVFAVAALGYLVAITVCAVALDLRPDVVRVGINYWPQPVIPPAWDYTKDCLPDTICHPDARTVHCSFHSISSDWAKGVDPRYYACTTDIQAPADVCSGNFECRIINGECKTVVNTIGLSACMAKYKFDSSR